jgi:hypothetical protein
MRDAYAGEGAIKAAGVRYLLPTPGQELDGALTGDERKAGYLAYKGYKARAVFPDYVEDAVARYIGMLHHKEAVIELPSLMEPLRTKATLDGESLQGLLRRINEQQLVTGRLGLLLDFPPQVVDAQPMPYIALYYGETIINWDNSADHVGVNALNLVVLDESGNVRDTDFTWRYVERYRVLQLGRTPIPESRGTEDVVTAVDSTVPDDPTEGIGAPVYKQGVFEVRGGTTFDENQLSAPTYRGAELAQVPFVFINTKDIVTSPDKPPLIGLGRACLTIYRGEADYRQTLYMQGQSTLVTIGTVRQDGEQLDYSMPLRVGAGAHIGLDIEGDAKYIGIGADGIEGQREALRDDRKLAEAKAGALINPSAGQAESGTALTKRVAAQTASLKQLAKAGAGGLENILRIAAEWMGQDPGKVRVTPNLEFVDVQVTGQELAQLMAARSLGAPLSLESVHAVLVDNNLAKFDFKTEVDKISEEDAQRGATGRTSNPPANGAQ